jgi:hypothetical protein
MFAVELSLHMHRVLSAAPCYQVSAAIDCNIVSCCLLRSACRVFKAHSLAGQAVLNTIHELQLSGSHADTPAFLSQLQELQELRFTLAMAPKRNRRHGWIDQGSSSSSSTLQPPGPQLLSLRGLANLTSLSVISEINTCNAKQQGPQRAQKAQLLTAIAQLTQLQKVGFDGRSSV